VDMKEFPNNEKNEMRKMGRNENQLIAREYISKESGTLHIKVWKHGILGIKTPNQ